MNDSSIRAIIAEHLAVPVADVSDAAQFQQDLGADSLDMIQLSMLLETQFGISVEDEEAERCLTVADALHLLRGKLAEAAR